MERIKLSRIIDLILGCVSIGIGIFLLVIDWPNAWFWPALFIVTGILEIVFDTGRLVGRLQKWILRLNVKPSDR